MPAHILVCLITNESMGGEPAVLGAPRVQSGFEGKGSLAGLQVCDPFCIRRLPSSIHKCLVSLGTAAALCCVWALTEAWQHVCRSHRFAKGHVFCSFLLLVGEPGGSQCQFDSSLFPLPCSTFSASLNQNADAIALLKIQLRVLLEIQPFFFFFFELLKGNTRRTELSM